MTLCLHNYYASFVPYTAPIHPYQLATLISNIVHFSCKDAYLIYLLFNVSFVNWHKLPLAFQSIYFRHGLAITSCENRLVSFPDAAWEQCKYNMDRTVN